MSGWGSTGWSRDGPADGQADTGADPGVASRAPGPGKVGSHPVSGEGRPGMPDTWPASTSWLPHDLEGRLHEMERMLAEAKVVPLSASVMLNRAELEGVLERLREALPESLRQARWVLRERDELLEAAEREATRLVADAEEERDRLIARTEVVQAANREADRVMEEAREYARQIRLEAEDYVDAKLANFEVVLHKTLAAVTRGREKLRGRLGTEDLAGEPGEDEGADSG